MSDMIIYKNDKDAMLNLCLRNAFKFATGQIKYTMYLGAQLEYAMEHSNENTKSILVAIFKNRGILDGI